MKLKQILNSFFIVAFLLSVFALPVRADNDLAVNFFYGSTCPHCKKVEPFIEELKLSYPEVAFNSFEVYENYANSVKLSSWFESYKVPVSQRGVPVVFVDGSYLLGDTPILENLEGAIQKLIAENAAAEPVAVNVAPSENVAEEVTTFDSAQGLVSPAPPEEPLMEEPSAPVIEEPVSDSVVALPDGADEVAEESVVTVWKDWHWRLAVVLILVVFYIVYRLS